MPTGPKSALDYQIQRELADLAMSKFLELSFYGVATKIEVSFKAFLETIEDDYSSEWDQQQVYGRMDPIGSFKSTVRRISLGWTVPSTGYVSARDNMYKTQTLVSLLYPVYEELKAPAHAAIKSAPMFKVKFANLITMPDSASRSTKSGTARTKGLLCAIEGFKFDPVMEEGFFSGEDGIFPQSLKFSCNLQIYHESKLGWSQKDVVARKKVSIAPNDFATIESEKRTKGFPYGIAHLTLNQDPKSSSKDTSREVQSKKVAAAEKAMTGTRGK